MRQVNSPRHPFAVALYAAGITQSEFGFLYGCSADFVQRVASGRTPAPSRFRAFAARVLDTSESELFPESARQAIGAAS